MVKKKLVLTASLCCLFMALICLDADAYYGNIFIGTDDGAYWLQANGSDNGIEEVSKFQDRGYEVNAVASSYFEYNKGYVDNDSLVDVVTGEDSGGLTVCPNIWYEYTAEGTLTHIAGTDSVRPMSGYASDNGMAIGDFDNNGSKELMMAVSWGNMYRFESSADDTIAQVGTTITTGVAALASGQFNPEQDSYEDLFIARNSYYSNSGHPRDGYGYIDWYCYIESSSSYGYKGRIYVASGKKPVDMAVGDFDDDEYMDIFVVLDDGSVLQMEYVGNWWQTTGSADPVGSSFGSGAKCVAIGDVDADGISELIVGGANGLSWYQSDRDGNALKVMGYETAYSVNDMAIAMLPGDPPVTLVAKAESFEIELDFKYRSFIYSKRYDGSSDPRNADIFIPALASKKVYGSTRMLASGLFGEHPYNENGFHMQTYGNSLEWTGATLPSGPLNFLNLPNDEALIIAVPTSPVQGDDSKRTGTIFYIDQNLGSTSYTINLSFPSMSIESLSFQRSIVRLSNGNLLAIVHGKLSSDTYYQRCMLIESTDLGLNWTYKSTVAVHDNSWMGDEGPSESDMIQLSNGNLLAVMRTGGINNDYHTGDWWWTTDPREVPMIYCISTDSGSTWSDPISLGQAGIFPDLTLLDDNKVALTYGRPGINIMFADATASQWSSPVSLYSGAGGHNNATIKYTDGDLVVIYAESDFNDRAESYPDLWLYPGYMNYLCQLKFDLTVTN